MKLLIVAILIIFLAAGAVFGLMAMSHEGEHMGNCFASLAQGVFCPQFSGLLDLIAFHSNVLTELSSAIFESIVFVLGSFVILFLAGSYLAKPAGNLTYQTQRSNPKNFSQYQARLTRWLSLFEKRDPLSI